MAGLTASPETDRPTDTGGASASTEGSATTTTGTELKKLKDLLPPDGDLSVFFLPFAYLAACAGAASIARGSIGGRRENLESNKAYRGRGRVQWTDENKHGV